MFLLFLLAILTWIIYETKILQPTVSQKQYLKFVLINNASSLDGEFFSAPSHTHKHIRILFYNSRLYVMTNNGKVLTDVAVDKKRNTTTK